MIGDGNLRFMVLRSFRVDRGGREVDLGPRLQRALLAILVVEAGHVVPVDRLIDLLWQDEPPAAAIASVQAYISQLRRALEPGRPVRAPARVLVTQDPGYVLRAGDGQVDALRFQALARRAHSDLAAGRLAAAAAGLVDALALWRGDPLADFAGEPWAMPVVTRLTEAHDLAVEDRVEACLALGGHAQAAAELEAMVTARPLRERRWAQLIVATYRCGRQADALRAYQRCRAVLAGELGLEPGPELCRDVVRAPCGAHDLAADGLVWVTDLEVCRFSAAIRRTGGWYLLHEGRSGGRLVRGLREADITPRVTGGQQSASGRSPERSRPGARRSTALLAASAG